MALMAITEARVVTARRPVKDPETILIEDGRIAAVGKGIDIPARSRRVDAAGASVIPGLIDAHCHAYGVSLRLEDMEKWPLSYVALLAARRLDAALRRGFTTVRDVGGGDPGLAKAVREQIVSAPRYLYTGPALSQTGGHGDGRDPLSSEGAYCGCATNVVDGVEAVRLKARGLLRQGAHAIKLLTSGGVISPTDPLEIPQYTGEEIAAACYEANRRGTYVTAHAYSPAAIRHSIDSGVRCIEHGNLLDAGTATAMAELGVSLVPTLATYDAMDRRGRAVGLTEVGRAKNTAVLGAGKEAIRLARAAGVRIGFGTDLMGELEDEQLQGLRLQCEVEGPERTIEAATAANAAILRLEDSVGRIEPGLSADLVVLRGDLLRDPEILWEGERTVIHRGKMVV
ncbi:MAG: amidohydrolase family protein [Bifidobacteriaceae bacterium]|jgi:imidazolonepropionase-like amidohydrolase|nr:amidohydrolase family protein [Bifidobacteriaceae bacterium]